jgi:hypothetical protein
MLAALLVPLDFDLSYIADRSIVDRARTRLIDECLMLNGEYTTPDGEIIPAATCDEIRAEYSKFCTFCTANRELINTKYDGRKWSEWLEITAPWWHNHRHHFPHIARCAQALLAIQATSVSCESMFSQAGYIFSQRRRSLDPSTLEAICMIRANIGPNLTIDQLVQRVCNNAAEAQARGQTLYPSDDDETAGAPSAAAAESRDDEEFC